MADEPAVENQEAVAPEQSAALDGEHAEDGHENEEPTETAEPTVEPPPACPLLGKLYGDTAFEPVDLVTGLPLSRIVAACWIQPGAEVCILSRCIAPVLGQTSDFIHRCRIF